jgi:hypothetical protein
LERSAVDHTKKCRKALSYKNSASSFSAFDTRISMPVGTCNGTPEGTLMEKSICEIQVKRRCYPNLQEIWSWVSVIFVVKSFGLGSIICMQGGGK